MNPHTIFYYPYGSFEDAQVPLLKAAALYFDKVYMLDPEKANSGTIGIGAIAKDVELLEQKGVLVRVAPEEVLSKYEHAIADAIRADLQDPEFVKLCETSGRAQQWTLALAKVPKEIRNDPQYQPLDRSMQRLMGDLPRSVAPDIIRYSERYTEVTKVYTEVYDEVRPSGSQSIEYRYADYPLLLGESIMVNHALFAGLLQAGATPLSDDPFHHKVLSLKIKRARKIPEFRKILEDQARQLKQDLLALTALQDTQLDLPAMSPKLPLEEVLEYRRSHDSDLQQAREGLGWLAREIGGTPWSKEFADKVDRKTIPSIRRKLEEAKKARDSWLNSQRGRNALDAIGLTLATAAATIPLILSPTPLMPIAIATAALALAGGTGIPALKLVREWREGKTEAMNNGLHYLLKI